MKTMKRIMLPILFALSLTSCRFDLTSNVNTIELPNTYGVNAEVVCLTPDFILNHEVTFDEILIYYTVRKNNAFIATVKIYVSDDQTVDNIELPGDEEVLDVTLGIDENHKSGTVNSLLLKDILNAKQPQFVIGAQNLSVNPLSTVYIDIRFGLKGTYKL